MISLGESILPPKRKRIAKAPKRPRKAPKGRKSTSKKNVRQKGKQVPSRPKVNPSPKLSKKLEAASIRDRARKGGKARQASIKENRKSLPSSISKRKVVKRDSAVFSKNGLGPFSGGGYVALQFGSSSQANLEAVKKLLKLRQGSIKIWQLSRKWTVTHGKHRSTVEGFSVSREARVRSLKEIEKALSETAVNAAKKIGFTLEYEGKVPANVRTVKRRKKVKTRGKDGKLHSTTRMYADTRFKLLLWFDGQHRQAFLG